MQICQHSDLDCLNQHELIRKYRCRACGEVMMCRCDEEIGRRHLPYQLTEGTELETQRRVPVTLGFQEAVCAECKGDEIIAAPMAQIHGHTSKIKRYYRREIAFKTMERFGEWLESGGREYTPEADKKRKQIESEVVQEIKQLHASAPKYTYNELSQIEVIKKYEVEVVALEGKHERLPDSKRITIRSNKEALTPEDFVSQHFCRDGYNACQTESAPFHVLFGTLMSPLIQDSDDPLIQIRGFDDRQAFEEGKQGFHVQLLLPRDFGTPGYGKRRAGLIELHLALLGNLEHNLKSLFDSMLPTSMDLRNYLWAYRPHHIDLARQILGILPVARIVQILRYLVGDYWGRYLGWPDLLIHKRDEYAFIEVKSSGDRLSLDQKRWIRDNYNDLNFPFKLAKIHKPPRRQKS